ncbi:MAG: ThiF family adenylyltransferase [Planctomycetales bacterium]|nr:ThiF family adenylyltransferase [Planctomycetales bacterium]
MNDPELFIDDDDRYSRLRLIAWWEQERLAAARVLVVGAGALGNEVLKNLALLGIGAVHVVDFDRIENSNLTRSVLFRARDMGRSKAEAAAEALRDMNPDTVVHPLDANIITDIGLGLFRDVDVVIGCLDNREARLWVNRCCWKVGTPWIDGGIQEINGVAKVFVPPGSACYECAMTEMDYRLINLRYSCPLLRQEDIQAGKVPTAPTISSMIAGLQTQEALKLIHGMPVAAGEAMVYNGIANQFYRTKYQRKEDCLSHEVYEEIVAAPLSCNSTAEQLFDWVDGQPDGQAGGAECLELDRDLVVRVECRACGAGREVMRAAATVGSSEANCRECGEPGAPVFEHRVARHSELAGRALRELGVPAYDVVRVTTGNGTKHILLHADREAVLGGEQP